MSEINNKEILYKLYDSSGTFITTWTDVVSDLVVKTVINGGIEPITVRLARLETQYGEGEDVKQGNLLKVYIFDKESGTNGVCVYSGILASYVPTVSGGEEFIDVQFYSHFWDMNNKMLANGVATEVTYNSYDPSNILIDLLTKYHAITGTVLNYGSGTIEATGTTVSYTFNANTFQECLNTVLELCPDGWYYRIGADDKVYLKSKEITSSHYFTIGKDIMEYYPEKRFDNIINTVYFRGATSEVLSTIIGEINALDLLSDPLLKAYYRFENGALANDSSGEGHTLTAISVPVENISGRFGSAITLAGDDAYSAVDHANFKPTGNFSISAWFKTGSTALQVIFQSFAYAGSKYAGSLLYINPATGLISFAMGKNTGAVLGTDLQIVTSAFSVIDSKWHNIVATWDGSDMRLYIDGILETKTAWANANAYQATNYVRIGCQNNTGSNISFFIGSLDDVAIFNGKVLTDTEINEIYNGKNINTVTTLYKKITNSGSVSTYGERSAKIVDERVTVEATAQIMADRILNEKTSPEIRIVLKLRDSNGEVGLLGYDIESLYPGQTCKIQNATSKNDELWDEILWDVGAWDYSILNASAIQLQIMSVEYHMDYAILELSNRQPDISKRIEDINRNLVGSQTADNPATPT